MEGNNETQEPNPNEALCREIFEVFNRKYQPTNDIKEADHYLTTSQIHTEITAHLSSAGISEKMVYNELKEAGYTFDLLDGSPRFVWLLRNRD
jgi:hypothetical protein